MTMIPTTDELLRAARENPEFREEFRRLILTDDLLAMPAQLSELTVVTANLAATGEATNQRLDGIEGSLGSLNTGMNDVRGYTLGGQTGTSCAKGWRARWV